MQPKVTRRTGIMREFWWYLRANQKWWLAPIISVFLLLMLILVLSSTGVAPLMYTFF